MGNCQAAEAATATVVIQHPGGRLERVYCSLTASHIMASNPGYYIAVIITASSNSNSVNNNNNNNNSAPVTRYLKLLRPDDTLHIGHVYRLVSFEEVLREFASKKHVKLSRLLVTDKEKATSKRSCGGVGGRSGTSENSPAMVVEPQMVEVNGIGSRGGGVSRHRAQQWRPALQSISEIGS